MTENKENKLMLSDEVIISKIYFIRGQKVMLDRDLAELYGVETKYLKRQVRRNIDRFPDDFMFKLTDNEFKNWRSQFVTSNSDAMGLRYAPFCFTNLGVPQLSTVLKSKRAIMVNLHIMRVFNKMHEMILNHQELFFKLNELEKKIADHDDKLLLIFEYMKQFEQTKQEELKYKNRKPIGFKRQNKK